MFEIFDIIIDSIYLVAAISGLIIVLMFALAGILISIFVVFYISRKIYYYIKLRYY